MSLWTGFLDWILGRDIMSIENLKAVERSAVEYLEAMFEDVNGKIDTDDDGMVSVREAWVLLKGSVAWVRAIIKGMMRCQKKKR